MLKVGPSCYLAKLQFTALIKMANVVVEVEQHTVEFGSAIK